MHSELIRGPMFEILEKAIKRGKTITVYTLGHVFHGDITYLDGGIVEISESTFGDLISISIGKIEAIKETVGDCDG